MFTTIGWGDTQVSTSSHLEAKPLSRWTQPYLFLIASIYCPVVRYPGYQLEQPDHAYDLCERHGSETNLFHL